MVTRHLRIAGLLLAVLLPLPATAGDFVDTRLTFIFSDDDVLHGPGETQPSSPGARIGAGRSSTIPGDNYDTKYTGFETLSHVVLYKRDESYFKNLITEGALALNVLVAGPDTIRFQDASSYVRLTYRPDGWDSDEGLSFTGFPVSADRFRLGYSYRLSWAGNPIFPRADPGSPNAGFKLQLTRGPIYLFAGLKTALILDEESQERQTNYGGLFGGGWDITDNLRWEVGGGIFERGTIARLDGEPLTAGGASTQLTWHVGMPIGTSIDFKLYRNDPEIYDRFFQPEIYDGSLSYSISAEYTVLAQNLEDPDRLASTVRQVAMAGDLQGKLKVGKSRIHFIGSYRDLPYILFNVPSFVPFQALPDEAETEPELLFTAGYDYFIESLRLTPGIVAAIQLPAAVRTETIPGVAEGVRTVVVRDESTRDILPAGEDRKPIYALKATSRLDLSDSMAAAAEVFFTYDENRATIADDAQGIQTRIFDDPESLGFNLLLQARF